MPLTPFQRELLLLLARNRNPDSYVGGATVIQKDPESARFSEDLDIFHDVAESVAKSAEADKAVLDHEGYRLDWILQQPTFLRAVVTKANDSARIDWAYDSAFRFFPTEKDPEFGYRLHWADAATNKVLAFAGRTEARDFVDVLDLHARHLTLGALCWAACGKDAGFTPELLIEEMNRHTHYRAEDFRQLALKRPPDPVGLKKQWLQAQEQARDLVRRLPAEHLGCLYLDRTGKPVTPVPNDASFASLRTHFGSVRGAWPRPSTM